MSGERSDLILMVGRPGDFSEKKKIQENMA